MNENEVNSNLSKLLYKNRYKIGLCGLVFAIISGVVTLYIPKKYSASGIIYPTRSNNIKDEAKDPNFGLELQADKLNQLFSSEAMFNHVVDKFDLINYYELDTSNDIWYDKLKRSYFKDISVVRNQYLSLTVSAVMKDAQLAADIVNDMIAYIDTVRSDLYLQNTKTLIGSLSSKIEIQEKKVDSILNLIFVNDKLGSTNTLTVNKLEQLQLKKQNGSWQMGDGVIGDALLTEHSPELEKQINEYYHELGILNNYKLYYTESMEKIELPFPSIYSVSKAKVNHKKTSPTMSINVILGFIFGLILSTSLILIWFKWKAFKLTVD